MLHTTTSHDHYRSSNAENYLATLKLDATPCNNAYLQHLFNNQVPRRRPTQQK